MQTSEHHKLVIVGAGPAGLSAGLYAARADLKPLILSGMLPYGQASLTNTIENYPGFPNGIGGTELGKLLEEHATRFGARIEFLQADSFDLSKQPFEIQACCTKITADSLILAMGADPKKLNIPGEVDFTGTGVSYCATCDGWFYKDKDIHVVGGGDSALEESLFLTRFARTVTIIHRRDSLRAGVILTNRAKNNPKINFLWETIVKEIRGEEKVNGLLVENIHSHQTQVIPSDGIFIFIGHSPNTKNLEGQVELNSQGFIRLDSLMQTSVPGVFAAGEIADPVYKQVITSAGMGAAASIQAIRFLEMNNR